MKKILTFFAALLLASCSITAPRDVGNANRITLSALDIEERTGHKHGGIKVDYPTAASDLDTYRIAVAKADGRQDYFAHARWDEFLPSVVQSALIETLTKSGSYAYVGSDENKAQNDYILHAYIEACTAVYAAAGSPPEAHIRIVFHLTGAHGSKVVRTFTVDKKARAESNTLASVAKAFNGAFLAVAEDVLKKLQTAL